MSDTNPPKERKKITITYQTLDYARCEEIGLETARLIDRYEPNAQRRALLWLFGRQIERDYDEDDVAGAEAMQCWVRQMLPKPQP